MSGGAGWSLVIQAAAETVVVRQAAGTSWFAVLVGIAQIIIALAIVTLVLATVFVGLSLLRKLKEKGGLVGQLLDDLIPLMRRMNRTAERIEAITETAKASVDHVDGTFRDASARVKRLLDGTERRVREFDALVEVARDRADDAFVGSVATLRGVRAGARALRNGRRGSGRRRQETEMEADGHEADVEVLEERVEHAIDVTGDPPASEQRGVPRVRPRRGRTAGEPDQAEDLTASEEADDASFERPRIRPHA